MTANDLGYVHQFLPGEADETVLLMLHGTGGDENDLVPLARALRPSAGILSPRGNVLERGMPRFFRRIAEGVFDQEDLAKRTEELGAFIEDASLRYGFDRAKLVAVGFSNGANIAASLLLRRPGALPHAILLSPMVPFEPNAALDLAGTRVFIGSGRADPIVPLAQVNRLTELLSGAGADVSVHLHAGGHTITNDEFSAAQQWLSN